MRAWASVVAGLVLAACSVEVEGARCARPFAADQCPAGQACGNDHRCGARAAACAEPCCPDGTEGCAASAATCGAAAVLRCDGADAVCGAWVALETCAAGRVCRDDAGAPACLCPLAEGTLHADAAAGSALGATPPPTGAAAPIACRFQALADALDAAAVEADGGAGVAVEARGAFRTSLEARPLVVAGGVTLRAAPDEVASVEVDGPAAYGLLVAGGATVEDVTVRSAGASAAGIGVDVACADETPVTLARVRVERGEGAGQLAAGVRVSAPCTVASDALHVSGAAAGLLLTETGTPASHAALTATGGSFTDCGRGVELQAGRLVLSGTAITDNEWEGVASTNSGRARQLTVDNARIKRNGDGGLVLDSNERLDIQGTVVCGNEAVTPRDGVYEHRLVGGVVFMGDPPTEGNLVFRGNQIFANTGDQVMVARAEDQWKLSGASSLADCPLHQNVFAGYVAPGRGVIAATAKVTATWNAWASLAPSEGTDYEATGSGSTVDAGATGSQFCPRPSPLPSCD